MDAKCGHHIDRDADGGTCDRCGTYLCAECVVEGSSPVLCTTCLDRLNAGPWVRHVRPLAVLLMVHGGLLAAMGVYYMLFGGFVVDELADIPVEPGTEEGLEYLPEMLFGMMALMGLAQLLPGALQVLAGWQLFKFRGLPLGWIGALAGLVSLLGCYCFPSALAMATYAAWVLSRDDVRARFAVGVSPAQTPKA